MLLLAIKLIEVFSRQAFFQIYQPWIVCPQSMPQNIAQFVFWLLKGRKRLKNTSQNSTERVTLNVSTVTKGFQGKNIWADISRPFTLLSKRRSNVTYATKYLVIKRDLQDMTFSCIVLKHFSVTIVRRNFLWNVSLKHIKEENIWKPEIFLVRNALRSFSAEQMFGLITSKYTVIISPTSVTYAHLNLRGIRHGATIESPTWSPKTLHVLYVKRGSNVKQVWIGAWNCMGTWNNQIWFVLLKTVECLWQRKRGWMDMWRDTARESDFHATYALKPFPESLNWRDTLNMFTVTQRENLNAQCVVWSV